MYVITETGCGCVDLDKFESVVYREGLLGGYPIEAIGHSGYKTITTELARLWDEDETKKLIKAITDAWIQNQSVFDIQVWLEEIKK